MPKVVDVNKCRSVIERLSGILDGPGLASADWAQKARAACKEVWAELGKSPSENFDEVLSALNELHLGSNGNAPPLESDIKEIQLLKKEVLDRWPWTTQPLPPGDRGMVARSMAAIARGERGERIEDLIHRISDGTSRE